MGWNSLLPFVRTSTNLVLPGPPGIGKSHVAMELALAACRQGRRLRFYNAAGLVNDLIKAHFSQERWETSLPARLSPLKGGAARLA